MGFIADGILAHYIGDDVICWKKSGLSVRAGVSLRKAGIERVTEINARRLLRVRNCGPATTKELLQFADSWRKKHPRCPS
jgi:hypothetical protein